MYHVISLEDPGYQNWLDPVGVATGLIHVRIDGLTGVAEPWHQPILTQTTTAELEDIIPGYGQGVLSPDRRAIELAQRRRHIQKRYGR